MSTSKLIAIAIKPAHGAPLELVESAEVTISEGLVGNVEQASHRRVTLLSKEQWAEVTAEAGADLPWQTRRANLLVEGIPLASLKGKMIRIGDVELNINGETKPCGQMDDAHDGLQGILKPECRGGMHASVQKGGTMRAGDAVVVVG